MTDRMNKLLKKLDKALGNTGKATYAKCAKITGIHSYEKVNEWVHFDADAGGAHIPFHYNFLTDTLEVFIDCYHFSEKD